jgi:hypothetical protein
MRLLLTQYTKTRFGFVSGNTRLAHYRCANLTGYGLLWVIVANNEVIVNHF